MIRSSVLFRILILSCILLSCFVIDLTAWGLYGMPILYSTRFLFYVLLCAGASLWWISLAGFFVLMHAFMFQGTFGSELLILVPLALFIIYIRRVIDLNVLTQSLLIGACLLIAL